MKKQRIDIGDVQHPLRQKAIYLMESIAVDLGNEDIFDGELWFTIEDMLTSALYEAQRGKYRKECKKYYKTGYVDPCDIPF